MPSSPRPTKGERLHPETLGACPREISGVERGEGGGGRGTGERNSRFLRESGGGPSDGETMVIGRTEVVDEAESQRGRM